MMRRFSVAAFMALVMATPAAFAAGHGTLKIGVVDWQAVLRQSTAGQEDIKKITNLRAQLSAKIKPEEAKLKKEHDELTKNAKIETAAQQKKAEEAFQSHVQSYQQDAQSASHEYQQKQQALLKSLNEKLQGVVQTYGKEHGFDMIIEKGAVPYNADSVDVTAGVLKAFDKAQPHAPPPATLGPAKPKLKSKIGR